MKNNINAQKRVLLGIGAYPNSTLEKLKI